MRTKSKNDKEARPSSSRAVASRALFPALGAALGLATGALILDHIRSLDPHAALVAAAPDRVYVGLDCEHSRRALDAIARTPGPREVVAIPTDLTPSPARAELCGEALAALRKDGSLWWSVVPSAYLCSRLVSGARAFLEASMGDQPRIPAWVVDNTLLEPGFTDESQALLRDKGFFAAGPVP